MIDWLIDWIEFYAVLEIFHPCNGGKKRISATDSVKSAYMVFTCGVLWKVYSIKKNAQYCEGLRNDMCTIYSQILIQSNQWLDESLTVVNC